MQDRTCASPVIPAGKSGTEDEAQRLNSLASDPAYSGTITARSMQAAQAALGLEKLGLLPAPVRRDSTGAADFIDGRGRSWDAKTVNSGFVAHQDGYDLATSMTKIGLELLLGANVIFVTENLSAEAVSELKTAVDSAGLGSRVLFWPAGVIAAGAVQECG